MFHIRPKATAEDRFEITVLYDADAKGHVKVPRRDVYRTLIERFVVGWTGVTEDGKPVPFSMDALGRFPVDKNEDVMIILGHFIFKSCGLWETDEAAGKKKG